MDFSNYWQWDEKDGKIEYKNKIPLEIVEIFEKYGFIWGGRWYHFDTMHFEYRPELLVD
ncbi:M15 family metallopeptidase [Aliarcobacter butzleri]|uniref:M15 family metallopeptidase n=1 Tax=Aliarcobacter butzleri TaxID=28197 RepID=UPI001D18BC70|nr:M15 family metallopeptidase [Aliarcobacter butzleri]MCG3705331.1 M15 family metallopeptidase [Aliarcobacter butzleri]